VHEACGESDPPPFGQFPATAKPELAAIALKMMGLAPVLVS
jgi:hypothetical protein